jgi:fatty acid synthase subunit alpha
MRDGNIVVNIRGEKDIQGSAAVSQSSAVYVLIGQGSQEPGMDMDLYNSSPVTRGVWEGADVSFYGFSIVKIVKDNPKEKNDPLRWHQSQAIRQRYMDNLRHNGQRRHAKTLPLFAEIDVGCPKYTFTHPAGLLFAQRRYTISTVPDSISGLV